MDPKVVSRNGGSQHQSSSNATKQVHSHSLDPMSASHGVVKRVQQFPKHKTVKLSENNFLL